MRRKKKNQKKKDSLIPQIKATKLKLRKERHVAQDLYLVLRCFWHDEENNYLSRIVLSNWEGIPVMECTVNQYNFVQIRDKIMRFIQGKILIGYRLDYCLYSLQIQHPWSNIRDAATYLPFMQEKIDPLGKMVVPRTLAELAEEFLRQTLPDPMSPDYARSEAKACMDLYRSVRYDWENNTTKLLQQMEKQKAVSRQPEQLTSICEDSPHEESETRDESPGVDKAPPLTKWSQQHSNDDSLLGEDQSTQAPTEPTSDDATDKDDLSVRTRTSSFDANSPVWVPAVRDENEEPPEAELEALSISPKKRRDCSDHPLDSDDWLEDEDSNRNDSAKVTVSEREVSSHPLDADDWLEQGQSVPSAEKSVYGGLSTAAETLTWGLWSPRKTKASSPRNNADDSSFQDHASSMPSSSVCISSEGVEVASHSSLATNVSTNAWTSRRHDVGSSHPWEADDWLSEVPSTEEAEQFLPSHLLNDSSDDSDHESTRRRSIAERSSESPSRFSFFRKKVPVNEDNLSSSERSGRARRTEESARDGAPTESSLPEGHQERSSSRPRAQRNGSFSRFSLFRRKSTNDFGADSDHSSDLEVDC